MQFILESSSYQNSQTKRYISSIRIVENSIRKNNSSFEDINDKLSSLNVEISNINLQTLINLGLKGVSKEDEPIEFFYYDNKTYFHLKPYKPPFMGKKPPPFRKKFEDRNFRPEEIILIDNLDERSFKNFWLVVLTVIDVLLIWFFIFLRNKLKPLLSLKENMISLSKGELTVLTKVNGTDEISQVANEFDNAIKQLRQLRESRNLFLRNIMHELKTPITKGKLISDTLEENERKYILIRVFQRLEYLLSEFAKVEELTSGKIKLDKNKYRAADLIDQALDILLLDDTKIDIHYQDDLILDVDFDLFSISLKNLIDNAIKYNTNGNPEIFIEKDCIKILNKGHRLKKDLNEYYKPFNHEYETSEAGLGLGLYISNNIIKIHKFNINYKYESEFHSFIINVN